MRRTLALCAFLGALGALSGCELIASVDHDLIDQGGAGGGGGTAGSPTTGGGGEGAAGGGGGTGGGEGGGATCEGPGDCPVAPACQEATCENNTCGVDNLPELTACEIKAPDDGVCTAEGECVVCVGDEQCEDPTPVCDTATHVCVAEHCTNDTQDADETDLNCGGDECPGCANNLLCVDGDDCLSGVCNVDMKCVPCSTGVDDCPANEFCNAGVCEPDKANGLACGGGGECESGFCDDNGSGSDICCATACDGDCRACSGANAACENFAATEECGDGPTCNGDDLKPQDMCDGNGACATPADIDCMAYTCNAAAPTDACFTACSTQTDCAASGASNGNYCAIDGALGTANTCNDKKALGGTCAEDFECESGNCGGLNNDTCAIL
ncbi:MAG: hypothetical protein HOW73_25970 [Polyangiaceae bacterium]|nr:hypothetical protein [Polyangiaceae bacterium]